MSGHPGRRGGLTLVEVLIAGVVFLLMVMVFQGMFSVAHGGEGRDLRRTQAMAMAAELMEQVTTVHSLKADLPLWGGKDGAIHPDGLPEGVTMYHCPGGQLFTLPDVPGFRRRLSIEEYRIGGEDALLRPDRNYRIRVEVEYPGPFGEDRMVRLVTTRSRPVVAKPRLEPPPWIE